MPDRKTRLAVVFGGRSGEHDVSCNSAAGVFAQLDRRKYDILAVRIGRDGVWTTAPDAPGLSTIEAVLEWQRTGFSRPESHSRPPYDGTPTGSIFAAMRQRLRCDVVFPALHGPLRRGRHVAGVARRVRDAVVGSGVTASALSMDKEYTKKIAAGAGLTVSDAVVLRRGRDDLAAADRDRLGLPVFVKPAREGSSIGVSKVDDWAGLPDAVAMARKSDEKVLVEAAIVGREIDIGVLERPGGELEVSPPMEILTSGGYDFFDYRAKYGDATTVLDVPATLNPAISEGLGQDALRVFRALDCGGLLRVDFFVRADGSRVLNEVNTFPGFTSASQYPRMWQAAGLSYRDLLDVLIDTARWHADHAR